MKLATVKNDQTALPRLIRSGRVAANILDAIGDTPLVLLEKLFPDLPFQLYAKLEALNPGGSIKDRPAFEILQEGLRSGTIGAGTVIVESSSGNMGIALAQACRYHGLRFICVIDPKTSPQNLRVLRAYGAEIDLVAEPDAETGEFLKARLDRVRQLVREVDRAVWPNQYESAHNPGAHYRTTMHEVATALDGQVDYLFVGTSTCGTIRGCAEYVRDHGLSTRIVAVDALGSRIFSDIEAKRRLPGLGAAIQPPLLNRALVDEVVHVTDLDSIVFCRHLVAREAILAGGSSGGVLAGVHKLREQIPAGARCVALLPDRGERYLETVFCDQWVHQHFGEVAHLWHGSPAGVRDC
jgi:N-(2-amino-2-carboxyethyl)-L-glutamate synthase